MVNYDEISDVVVNFNRKLPFFCYKRQPQTKYTESAQNRWLVKGRTFSGKVYFRHLCWNCLKAEIVDAIQRQDELCMVTPALFPKWNRWLKNGRIKDYLDKFPPPTWNSPVWWFKLAFSMTDAELNAERKKFDTASLQSMVNRYGEGNGRIKYDAYVKTQARAGCTLDYFIEKYGDEEGMLKYQSVCKSKGVTKKNCIQKYGKDAGSSFFKQYCQQQSYSGCTLGYFIEKYGSIEGTKKYNEVCSQKSMSLVNFIRKYGNEEGKAKYKDYLSHSAFGYSRESQELFYAIDRQIGQHAIDNSFFFLKNHEYEITIHLDNGKSKAVRLDYALGSKAIEFNGDYWHANPLMYKADDVLQRQSGPLLAYDIWEHDQRRLQKIEQAGFSVLVVWENDYIADPESVVKLCINFLES